MSAHARFQQFMAEVLENPEAKASFEAARSRSSLIDTLVHLRRRLGLTQTEVARRMNVKQPTISGLETEGSDPRLSTIQRYAAAVEAEFIWEIRPKAEIWNSPYEEPANAGVQTIVDPRLASHVSHEKPSRRAKAWLKVSRRGTYGLAA